MKRSTVSVLLIVCVIATRWPGWITAAPAGSPAPTKAEKSPKAKAKNKDKKNDDKSPGTNLFGQGDEGQQSKGQTKKEIYTNEAFINTTKNMEIFNNSVHELIRKLTLIHESEQ